MDEILSSRYEVNSSRPRFEHHTGGFQLCRYSINAFPKEKRIMPLGAEDQFTAASQATQGKDLPLTGRRGARSTTLE